MRTHTVIHLHTDLSSGTTNIDSVTKFQQYIDRAVDENMKAIAFTEHGNIFSWVKKKEACEKAGLKYIHAIEMYITESLDEKVRDNYHTTLYARNFEGVLELNKLISKSYDRTDGHFYYTPRMTFEELINTSDNIIVGTACIGGILARDNEDLKNRFIKFLLENSHRCFLEVQHHQDIAQINHNKMLIQLSRATGLRLIAGTDTHALNETHARGRSILQKAKGIHFSEEDGWDITWKTTEELYNCLYNQRIFSDEEIVQAIENTNVLADMVEEFELDRSHKYPKLYSDPITVLKEKINQGILNRKVYNLPNYKEEYIPRIYSELDTYIHNNAVDYLLLDEDMKAYAKSINVYPGPARGSVSGSEIAYLIGMTEMDSIKHKLNFERFMNSERVSLADVDTDWAPEDRDKIKEYIYNKPGLYCADIVTFNTVALKGSIRDVCRALYKGVIPNWLQERMENDTNGYGKLTDETAKLVKEYRDNKYLEISNYICENIETREQQMRDEYPEVFEYVDIINGTVVSIGTHP